ncbi:proteasome component region PCI domain-containing protein [Planoprotostelium fungivorum]|uniref:Proteasome component region PCI domain-containing protein n=1 Tax=Planoprotostelium fungivorum TaxID=1890364 RepID=A0A2P6MQU8_9EUKA|nr:proteasome component region PCI domain-containing protein [Planoprotostelium fungivorum]
MSSEELTSGNGLAPFLQLAKSSKGKACTAVISQALSAPNVYVFGELLDMSNVQQLAETDDRNVLELLKIFAYGKYSDYRDQKGNLPNLTAQQEKKLRHLTIVSLSAHSKTLNYKNLQSELDITELRELEDLIIDAIYLGVIKGKLDQKHHRLEIESTMGRDLKPSSLDDILTTLNNWTQQAEALLVVIGDRVAHANKISQEERQYRSEMDKKIENARANIRNSTEGGEYGGSFQDIMEADHDDRGGRKGRKGTKSYKADFTGGFRRGQP